MEAGDILFKTQMSSKDFEKNEEATLFCTKCYEYGHMEYKCIHKIRKFPCIFCSDKDHRHGQCYQVTCHKCKGIGHPARLCNSKFYLSCKICKMIGHTQETCMVRDEPIEENKLAEATCYLCKGKGHTVCKEPYKADKEEIFIEKKIMKNEQVKQKRKKNKKTRSKIEELKIRSIMNRKKNKKALKNFRRKG
ncbi:unnamed protein product [Blepharisma stoltei]|uniref:CCHC-type domain-containing protein n=1 Tax=Blepharisma stoltei TaxID=1481888 RepID=A0AAU9IVM0_9CILI|nr:unnamed protein product [Blepharisma stoltei]